MTASPGSASPSIDAVREVERALATRDAWSPANAPAVIATLNTMDYHALAFDPRDANVVYFGHHEGVMKSADGGGTWTPILREGDAMNLVTIDNTIIMAGHQVFQRSDDSGRTWKKIATNLPDHDIHGFAISPSNPKTFFAFIVSYGLWRSDDAGATWTLILRQAQDKFSKELPDTVLALAALGTNPETLYAGTLDKGLLKSVDGGIAWKPVSGLSARPALGLAQDPRDALGGCHQVLPPAAHAPESSIGAPL